MSEGGRRDKIAGGREPGGQKTAERESGALPPSDDRLAEVKFTGPKIVLAALLSFHALVVLTVLLPSKSVLHRSVSRVTAYYATLTGNKQNWDMFHTIPYKHRHDAKIEITDHAGNKHWYGALVPGLRPYDTSYFRYHSTLSRLTGKTYKRYLRPYIVKVKNEVEASGLRVKKVRLHLPTRRIRYLKKVRSTGEISFEKNKIEGPWTF